MQQIQYFKTAWGDIKNSPGWFGKLCLLALLNFIPIFGQIVMFGYLYGWAREIAWGTHEPLPTRIFANEDGKLYRRGWFILVLVFVVAVVPSIVMSIGSNMQGVGFWGVAANSHAAASSIMAGIGFLIYLVGLVGAFFLSILAWIGSMRISIYDRLSAGFQIGKLWKMFRHDTGGIMRIFGMNLLVGLIIGIILSILYTIVIFLIIFAGIAGLAASGYNVNAIQHMSDAQAAAMVLQFIAGAGVVGFFGFIILAFVTYVAQAFVMLLVARAMGYWTRQFDVPRWRGQDDPMPFETAPPAAAAPMNPVPPAANTTDATASAPAAPQQNQTLDWYGNPVQQAQPAAQAAPAMAPVVPTAATAEDSFAEQTGTEEAFDAEASAEETTVAEEATTTAEEPAAAQPGQLSGFTYAGASSVPTQVTPSGADPSAPTTPDLLVVLPEDKPEE